MSGGSRMKRDGKKKPPPLSFRTPQLGVTTPRSRPGSRGLEKNVTGPFRPRSGRSRHHSLQSIGSIGFKDLLDAQSEINPADFRTRIKAAGAKEYGEDVAERNMGQNGYELESAHVQAFYAQPPKQLQEDENEAPLAVGPKTRTREAGSRKRPPNSLGRNLLPDYKFPVRVLAPNMKPASQEPFERRESANTFIPPPEWGDNIPPALALHLSSTSLGAVLRVPTPDMRRMDPSCSAIESSSSVVPQRPKTSAGPPARKARRPRDSVMLTKMRAEMAASEDTDEDDTPLGAFARSATHSHRISSICRANSLPRSIHGLHALQSSVSSSTASRDTVIHPAPLFLPRSSSLPQQAQEETAATPSTNPTSVDHPALTQPPGSAPAPC
jgi:hypothetical protein